MTGTSAAAQSFEALPRPDRVRRLRRLAVEAVAAFGLAGSRLTFLTDSENTTFRVDPAGHADGRCVLRIHRPAARTVAEIASELGWLAALRRDTALAVPESVPSRDGSPVVLAGVDGVPGPRHCVLFRWLAGRFVPGDIAPDVFARVGSFTSALHAHAAGWDRPAEFRRGRPVPEDLVGALGADAPYARLLAAADRRALEATVEAVAADVAGLGTTTEVFGLIHADLHQFNVLFHRGEVRAIDFDDCGPGHWLYDVAVALVGAGQSRAEPPLRDAFLEGYRRVRPLPGAEELLGSFMAARRLILLRWALGDRGGPEAAAFVAERVRAARADVSRD